MRKYIKKIMVMIVVIIFLLGICISKNEYMQNDTSQSLYLQLSNASEFVLNKIGTKFRYQEKKEKYDYAKSMTIEKTENIVKKIGFDISQTKWKDNLENEKQPIYELYEDSELRYALELHMYYKEKRQEIIIKPSGQDMQIFSKEQKRLEEANEWGNLGKYYLVQYIDLETGKEQVINILV